jgi:ADP-ribose pyrophosphatase
MNQIIKKAKNIRVKEVFSGKWLRFKLADYENNGSIIENYEYIERTTRKGNFDGVDVLGIVTYPITKQPKKVLLISNYRPPINKYVIQFPAGLLDHEGDGIDDAIRETKEETGFCAKRTFNLLDIHPIPQLSPILYGDPWKSNECGKLAILEIDGDSKENKNIKQELEASESIQAHLFDFHPDLLSKLLIFAETNDFAIEGKVYSYFLGISMYQSLMKA